AGSPMSGGPPGRGQPPEITARPGVAGAWHMPCSDAGPVQPSLTTRGRTMSRSRSRSSAHTLAILALAPALPACGSSAHEGAYLTIVGDRNVYVGYESTRRLSIRYHDADNQPLAGEVGFAVAGDLRGSSISTSSGVTNSQGIVEIDVHGGPDDTTFRIVA